MDTPFFQTSFLITKEDYISSQLTKNDSLTPKENKIILFVLGILAIGCGTVAFLQLHGSIYHKIGLLFLILTGFYILSYYHVIKPWRVRKKAEHFYDTHQRNIGSKNIRLYPDKLEIYAENRSLTIPKKYICQIIEGKHTILLFIDKNECVFFPKRIFQQHQLTEFQNAYHEKYVHL